MEEGERALKSGIVGGGKQSTPAKEMGQNRNTQRMIQPLPEKPTDKFSRMGDGYDSNQRRYSKDVKYAPSKLEHGGGSPQV